MSDIMLQSDFFDKETEALIDLNVIYGAGKHITDKCMIIFSKEIHVLGDSGYEFEGLHDANHNVGKALIALEAATYL